MKTEERLKNKSEAYKMKNSINIEKLKEVILKLQFSLPDEIIEVGARPNYLISVNELIQELSDIGLGIEEMDVCLRTSKKRKKAHK